ncbi:MAG: hypothetical protein HKN68_23095 [Saprospiraceae bacterium]|nr:hypothetical protein [Saprospiraceae bacterium]
MKKFYFLLALFLLVGVYACGDDMNEEEEEMMEEEDACEGTSFTYTANVKSIVDSSCALSGCHDGGSTPPNFTTYDGIKAFATGAASRTAARNMPPAASGISLSDAEIKTIMCWAENGAPE